MLAAFVTLVSCSEDTEKQVNTQVVAKVNGDEISIHQVNFGLSQLGKLDEAQTEMASKKVLEKLIDLQLLEQKAIEAKLDRDPNVMQALEASKKKMLAQAYIQKEIANIPKPTTKDIDSFYESHPELFSKRHVFNLQELAIGNGSEQVQAIESVVESKTNISEVAEWLKQEGYQFSLNANVRAAEQLPSKLLEELKNRQVGDMITVVNGKSVNVINIAALEQQPISKDKAKPIIEKYFVNKRKKEKVKSRMDAIKQAADIQYVGVFAEKPLNDQESISQEASQSGDALMNDQPEQSDLDKGLAGF